MTLWSSPHPKESAALSLGQAQQSVDLGKIKELADTSAAMPASANSFASDGSDDAGFEEGSIDMGEEETDEGIQIDCIQTLTEFEPISGPELRASGNSPLMSDCKTAIPLPPPPMHIGSGAYGGNQAYVNLQNTLPRIMERPASPMQSYWNSNTADSSNNVQQSRTRGDVGLNNIGNTCFMNSGLQCLVHTSPLAEFFLRSDSFERTSTSLVYQFSALIAHVWFGEKGAISLHDFKLVLGNKYVQFKDCRQHDCQEFLAVLLDILHEELKSKRKPALSLADSSVSESFIEVCSRTENEAENVPVIVDVRSDVDTEAPCESNNDDIEGSPVPKRLKLETQSKTDTDTETVELKVNSSHVESSDKHAEAEKCCEDKESEACGESSNREQLESPTHKAEAYWDKYMKENDTVIASTFQGMLKSAVTCSECSFISETYEPFMYLSLPIPRVMEKQISVTYISMKDRIPIKVEITLHLMGTTGTLIQEVIRKLDNGAHSNYTKHVAAEVFNHRVSRVLEDKLQLRNISTNSNNIYVFELNDNFVNNINDISDLGDIPPTLQKETACLLIQSECSERLQSKQCDMKNYKDATSYDASTSTSSLPVYGPMGAPVGGGFYDVGSSTLAAQGVAGSSDEPMLSQNDNFNKIQCNICLEDYSRSEVRKHNGCSCVLCEECIKKSAEHFQTDVGQTQEAHMIKCAVCLQIVDSKKTFTLMDGTPSAVPPEYITMSVLFRNEPGTDANNNSSWSLGLFGYPWLITVPSYVNAAELVEYIESINPAPDVTHRLLSVKSDGKSCGQCVYSTRCNGCEIPKEGMISLNSCNSILISFVDMSADQVEQMQPPDMVLHNELSPTWQYNRNEEPTIDIHDCLRTFSETEHLDEQNPWFCPRCEKNQRATKALSICKFPNYLIVYLKRFVFLDQSSNKLNNRLTFPINDLDVSDYVTEGFGAHVGKYNLYSCVCHFGSASAGHYTAYAKNPVTNKWHYFNDDTIVERAPAESEYASAYVLFYEKQGMGNNIPIKCNRQLPDINSFSSTSTFTVDTRGSYLPGEPSVSAGPVRVDVDFMNKIDLQVDSTSSNFAFPHTSSDADLLGLEADEGVGNETSRLADIRDGLGLPDTDSVVVTSSTSEAGIIGTNENLDFGDLGDGDSTISTTTENFESTSNSGGGADSTSI